MQNKKYLSVLGDSMSSYNGISNDASAFNKAIESAVAEAGDDFFVADLSQAA